MVDSCFALSHVMTQQQQYVMDSGSAASVAADTCENDHRGSSETACEDAVRGLLSLLYKMKIRAAAAGREPVQLELAFEDL